MPRRPQKELREGGGQEVRTPEVLTGLVNFDEYINQYKFFGFVMHFGFGSLFSTFRVVVMNLSAFRSGVIPLRVVK